MCGRTGMIDLLRRKDHNEKHRTFRLDVCCYYFSKHTALSIH
jgi:hypothetical protein